MKIKQWMSSRKKLIGGIAFAFATGVAAFNIFLAFLLSPSVQVADGWAALSRIMHFNAGEMSWLEYIFRPHGAHLHSIVYFFTWIDYKFVYGQQILTEIVSLGATGLYCVFLVFLVVRKALNVESASFLVIIAASATAAVVTGISDQETMLQPFQVVLSFARLSYALLLWFLIGALISGNKKNYVLIISISMLAVTFHGTGYVFAVSIILAHLLICRNPWWFLSSAFPMVSAIFVQSYFSTGGGELSNLGEVLNWDGFLAFFPSVSAFFVVPFAHWIPAEGTTLLLVAGFILFVSISVLTICACVRILGIKSTVVPAWWSEAKKKRADGMYDRELVFFAIMGLVVLMSASATALFWIVRTDGSGVNTKPYQNIFVATRYGATSSLAYVMVIVSLLHFSYNSHLKKNWSILRSSLLTVGPLLILFIGIWASILTFRGYQSDDRLNISVAGLSLGLSPFLPETESIWLNAKDDWYWNKELPFVVAAARAERIGPWHNLPTIGTTGIAVAGSYPIEHITLQPVTGDSSSRRCGFSGTLSTKTLNLPKSSFILPVSTADGVIAGYAVLTRQSANLPNRDVRGFVLCPNGIADSGTLFVNHDLSTAGNIRQQATPLDLQGFGTTAIEPLSIMKGGIECKVEPKTSKIGSLDADVKVTIRNLSDFDWKLNQGKYPLGIGVHYWKNDGTLLQWDDGFRIPGDLYIASRNSREISISFPLLDSEKIYFNQRNIIAEIGLVQDGVAWFKNISCKIVLSR